MSPKISVLIPVYNSGKYLTACLQAIQQQNITDIEIICIDDGSIDNSLELLHCFQCHEPRLRIFTQPNAGVAATRNRLLKEARGTYIAFVDADDIIAPQYLEKLYTAAEASKAEITKCFFQETSEDGTQYFPARCSSLFYQTPSHTLLSRFVCGYYDSVVWGKLFRRRWLQEKQLSFLEGRIAEDLPFVIQAFTQAKQITIVPENLYFYRKGLTDCITAQRERMIIDQLKNLLDLQNILQAQCLWDEQVSAQWIKQLVWRLCAFRKLTIEKRNQYLDLQQQTFRHIKQVVGNSGWKIKLRWSGLFILVRLCGWKSVYVWTKIFR